ncbi:MAG: hypothetical protein P4L31_04970 [Candidatus Babeliales bacterium]|nr:hypothetical protein [Candidatus Babeliales bacterium]
MNIANVENTELTDSDLKQLLGNNINIIPYPNLKRYKSLNDCFGKRNFFIIFFETESALSGHWTMMLRQGNTYEYFDPYGLGIDCDKKYIEERTLTKLKENEPILINMCHDAISKGFTVFANTIDYQRWSNNVGDCGRHCAVRASHANLTELQYYNFLMQYMKDNDLSDFDECVSEITYQVLKK